MSEPKHTPGPWILSNSRTRIEGSESIHTNGRHRTKPTGPSSASYSETVCEITCDTSLEGPAANINLICAAPRMLETLKEIAKGEGAYDMNKLKHAANTIRDMKKLASDLILWVENPPVAESK